MRFDFSSMLTPGQWLLLGLVPPAIVALYFLKLRRQPVEVPSTYLWHRTIEDLHVNSLWQRLRQSLLLYLQLLMIGLLMLACLRPHFRDQTLVQDRFVFMIDTSASMSASDVQPTRLAQAKEKASGLIDQMKSGDAAMIISFSDGARVEQPFTTNHGRLRRQIRDIQGTQRVTDISEALQAAAGLANPGRTSTSSGDVQVADALPADVVILSDGRFRNVPDFSWGNLEPIYVPIGEPGATNVGITAFSALPFANRPDQMQALVQIENFGDLEAEVEVALYLNDKLLDASRQTVPAEKTRGVEFAFERVDSGELKLVLSPNDVFLADNVAFAGLNQPERARVMIVTSGNEALETAFQTPDAQKLSDVSVSPPSVLTTDEYRNRAVSGSYDLIVFDQCAPEDMPQANTLFIGRIPPGDTWKQGETVDTPQIIDTDLSHPMMTYVDVSNASLVSGSIIAGPPGHHVLLETDAGPMIAIAPREGFEDVVIGFALTGSDEKGQTYVNTDWPIRLSFPLFFRNLLEYLGRVGGSNELNSARPGESIALRTGIPRESVQVTTPSGKKVDIPRNRDNVHRFHGTDELGLYLVHEDGPEGPSRRFAVNLFDRIESQITPAQSFETSWTEVKATEGFETTRRDLWRWIVLFAIGVLMLEWYIYNRRVYL